NSKSDRVAANRKSANKRRQSKIKNQKSKMPDELDRSVTFTEKLVAYLDGELPEAAARDVEQSLASDPAVRAEVEQLNRAWELLDLLPRPNASGAFSSRTLATLRAEDVPTNLDAGTEAAPTVRLPLLKTARFRVWPLAAWAVSLLLVSLLSFVAARRLTQPPADPLLDNLPLIEKLEVYSEVGDVEFLRQFQRKSFEDRGPPDGRRPPERR
ncbi:MAG TPA: hypothetical protein VK137_19160, partial [Planctomycetaceae bacterium]|nr:hypothetical protein [Planctomycetaceae bacterium]